MQPGGCFHDPIRYSRPSDCRKFEASSETSDFEGAGAAGLLESIATNGRFDKKDHIATNSSTFAAMSAAPTLEGFHDCRSKGLFDAATAPAWHDRQGI
jgi:hypothetical protein